uniref:RNA-directed DNA polymerase n=1 Tax=Parastrongyloides trichosuri TaxID=131310 RepID=A0A0N4ZTV6_PARTI
MDGVTTLTKYLNPPEIDPNVEGLERFFRRNLTAIKIYLGDDEERKKYKEELKDYMESLMEMPAHNELLRLYRASREKFPESQLRKSHTNYTRRKTEELGEHEPKASADEMDNAIRRFKYYIEGKTTDIYTDQRAVLAIKSPKKNQSKLRRYQLALMAYNLNIYYKEGKANVLADLLSRNPSPNKKFSFAVKISSKIVQHKPDLSIPIQDFQLNEKETEHLSKLYRDKFLSKEGIGTIYIKGEPKIYVSFHLRSKLIKSYHENPWLGGHFEARILTSLIKRNYWWENMLIKIQCDKCLQVKFTPNSTTHWKGAWDVPERPWHQLNMDIRGALPETIRRNKYLLNVLDDFSKFAVSIPIMDITSETIIDTITTQIFSVFGVPHTIRLDNAKYFAGTLFQQTMKDWGVTLLFSTPHNHNSNGEV